ncbi:hypothetical protein SKAU_G00343120 [Synaphobranchus kaupii]|uniref:Uncharacterized protein n=1 Tax=Synaphobranchus kaupii TaxID=118154 RepID=A0A9Q1EIX8_SYNKA|nr:hypothetical protein SKAU_G00343120 [Synaphobranchus kaupii]
MERKSSRVGAICALQSLKKKIRSVVWDRLVELGIFVLPDVQPELEQGGAASSETPLIEEKEERPQPVTLPRFESLSPASSESVVGARLKIRLARLHLEQEANEKQEAREAKERAQKRELEHKLAIRTLEIEAETKLKLRKLELENAATQTPTSSRHAPLSEHYDVRRHVALPQFRETEVDAYFNTFERLATALNWPKDIWTTLLQCKLIGKAQDAVATLSLADSLNYEVVKAAVLRAYELVPEAYRQKFRDYRKALAQSFVEFATEKGTPGLWVDQQEVTGVEGGDVSVQCHYNEPYDRKSWCRAGGSCVEVSSGKSGRTDIKDVSSKKVYIVTMRELNRKDTGCNPIFSFYHTLHIPSGSLSNHTSNSQQAFNLKADISLNTSLIFCRKY